MSDLTDYEKAQVLKYLGYSIFEDDGDCIRAINSLSGKPLGPDMVRVILADLNTIRSKELQTIDLAMAIEDGSTKIRAHYTLAHIWRLGKQRVHELAMLLAVKVKKNIFSASHGDEATVDDPSDRRIFGPPLSLG